MSEENEKLLKDEKKSISQTGHEEKGFWGNFFDGLADRGAAQGSPLGYAMQIERNTPGYQEYLAKKADMVKEREARDINLDLLRKKRDDYVKGQYLRDRDLENTEDIVFQKEKMLFDQRYRDALPASLQGSGLTSDEIKQYSSSPEFQTRIDEQFGLEKLQSAVNNDPRSQRLINNFLRARNWKVINGNDGKMYLDMGSGHDGKRRIRPIDGQEIDKIHNNISAAAQNELKSRMALSVNSTLGNPIGNSERIFVEQASKYCRGSYTKARQIYQQVKSASTEEQQLWRIANQALKDFNSNAPAKARLAGLEKLILPINDPKSGMTRMPVLQRLGFDVDGVEMFAKSGNVNDLKIKKVDASGEWHDVSFFEIVKSAEENDILGHNLTARLGSMRESSLATNRQIFAREVEETKKALLDNKLNTPGGTGGKGDWFGKGENGGEDKTKSSSDVSAYHTIYGKENCEKLSKKQREGLNNAMAGFNDALISVAKKYGVNTKRDLPDEALKELGSYWAGKMDDLDLDPSVFYSPVHNMMLQRGKKKLLGQVEETTRKTQELESHRGHTKTAGGDADLFKRYKVLESKLGKTKDAGERKRIKAEMESIRAAQDEYNSRLEDADVHKGIMVNTAKGKYKQEEIDEISNKLKSRGR